MIIFQDLLEFQALYRPKKRGRKRKIDKMLEAAALAASANKDNPTAMSEAMAAALGLPTGNSPGPGPKRPMSPSQLDPETRIPVVNLEDGTRLGLDDCPMRKDLEEWLDANPAFMVDKPRLEEYADMSADRVCFSYC